MTLPPGVVSYINQYIYLWSTVSRLSRLYKCQPILYALYYKDDHLSL